MKKQSTLPPDNDSMLVSERRGQQKTFKILSKCDCKDSIKSLQSKLQYLQLKLKQVTSSLTINYNQQMQHYCKIIDEQKKRQNIQYTLWQQKQFLQSFKQKINNQLLKSQLSINNLHQQVNSWSKMLRDIKNWKSNFNQWSNQLENHLLDTFKNYKVQNDSNVKNLFTTVEEIGLLQRKIIDKMEYIPTEDKKTRSVSYNEKLSMYGKKNMSLENTAIYANRNYIR